jgi:hypothetical protein
VFNYFMYRALGLAEVVRGKDYYARITREVCKPRGDFITTVL